MTLHLDNAALLPLAALAAVPLLAHLFARSRPPRFAFSATDLLHRAMRTTQRIRRPRDWLLLALRTLLAAAVVALFLRPVLFSGASGSDQAEARNVVVIVDASASMGCAEGGQTRFDAACAEAAEVLRGLRPADRANLIWLDDAPDAVFPELASNIDFLQDALRRATVRPEAGRPDVALALATAILRNAPGRRAVAVISDFQRTNWADAVLDLPADLDLSYIPVGSGDAANVTVGRLAVEPATPLAGEEMTLRAQVLNFGPEPVSRQVFLASDGVRESRAVVVPAFGAATALFALGKAGEASLPVEVSLEEDLFPADDRRWTVARPRPHLRVGLSGESSPDSPGWARGLGCFEWARVQAVGDDELAGETRLDTLVVPAWDGTAAAALRGIAAGGCSLLLAPRAGVPAAAWSALFGRPVVAGGETASEQRREGFALRTPHPDDAVLAIFEHGGRGDPARVQPTSRVALPASALPPDAVPVLTYADGMPALTRCASGGGAPIWFWNVALDAPSGGFATTPEFVCLLGELLLQSRTARSADIGDAPCGTPLVLPGGAGTPGLTLLAEGDRVVPWQTAGVDAVSAEPPPPGLYRWMRQGQVEAFGVVDFPAAESDLRPMPPPAGRTRGARVAASGREVRQLRDGIPLWPWCLGLAVAVAVSEGGMAWYAGRVRRGPPA